MIKTRDSCRLADNSLVNMKPFLFTPEPGTLSEVVYYKNYSRVSENGIRETYHETMNRTIRYIIELGSLADSDVRMIRQCVDAGIVFPSGRSLWVGGTTWARDPANLPGLYNCSSTEVKDIDSFGVIMDLSMMGCGTGTMIEDRSVESLPLIKRRVVINAITPVSSCLSRGEENTEYVDLGDGLIRLRVGDSRAGWVHAFMTILRAAYGSDIFTSSDACDEIVFDVDLSEIRSAGSRLHGFGGVANPSRLGSFFTNVVRILASAKGRRLRTVEVSQLLDEIALVVVAGNIRRSAGLRQFDFDDSSVRMLKQDLYDCRDGKWVIDGARLGMQMSAHTRVLHRMPAFEEIVQSVRDQYATGEGAIEFAPEAIARGNADILRTRRQQKAFVHDYICGSRIDLNERLAALGVTNAMERHHRLFRYGLNPCGEIIGYEFLCNLAEVHLNRLGPSDFAGQWRAFYSAGIVAATFLTQELPTTRYQQSRDIDPIVGVSFTGLWDFFVAAFGQEWIVWMMSGRPVSSFETLEKEYLRRWRKAAHAGVRSYCISHKLKTPTRVTTVQPSGTKSLLTGASPGWHAPKALRYIRRLTFPAGDPIALACIGCGYKAVPAVRESFALGSRDIWDPNCQEWIIEIPVCVPWANALKEEVELEALPAISQFGLYMAVQSTYTDHNTSGTIELYEGEIETIASSIFSALGEGYVSVSLSGRSSSPARFPQLPIEPVSKKAYECLVEEVLDRRTTPSIVAFLNELDSKVVAHSSAPWGKDGCECNESR